jgi:hypothetical protein
MKLFDICRMVYKILGQSDEWVNGERNDNSENCFFVKKIIKTRKGLIR